MDSSQVARKKRRREARKRRSDYECCDINICMYLLVIVIYRIRREIRVTY
jgi:hypothetical protein